MVSAIGSSPADYAASSVAASTAGIEAQLSRYKKELSDCVSCSTADTPEGKAQIQELSNKINLAEARLADVDNVKQLTKPEESGPSTPINAQKDPNKHNPSAADSRSLDTTPQTNSPDATTGRFLDVYA